jgi:hypothetical protein
MAEYGTELLRRQLNGKVLVKKFLVRVRFPLPCIVRIRTHRSYVAARNRTFVFLAVEIRECLSTRYCSTWLDRGSYCAVSCSSVLISNVTNSPIPYPLFSPSSRLAQSPFVSLVFCSICFNIIDRSRKESH